MLSKLEILNFVLKYWNVSAFRNQNPKNVLETIKLFHPVKTEYELIRIGDINDGGYLLPNILDQVNFCLSAGVGKTSLFEEQLEKKNIISFLSDFSVDKPVNNLKTSIFQKKFINSYNSDITLNINYWIESLKKNNNLVISNSILKIDTEGAEYEILSGINENYLESFKILIIEFHNLEFLGNEVMMQLINSIKKKLLKYFLPVHIHPNNSSKLHDVSHLKVPSALEVTYLNKKLIRNFKPIDQLPSKLDNKNISKKKDINLPKYWYKNF